MVNVHHYRRLGAGSDAVARELFVEQWIVYQICIRNDYLSHKGAYGALHALLTSRFASPFSFLDLACGNVGPCVGALQGTTVAHYHGVDLALPDPKTTVPKLERLNCDIELEECDYVEAIRNRPEPADVVWTGLSLHHLNADEKQDLMREIRRMIGPEGLFAAYEPTLAGGEDRDGFCGRFETHARRYFTDLSSEELDFLSMHVYVWDRPESMDSWRAIGEGTGFAKTDLLFTDPFDFFRVICFSG